MTKKYRSDAFVAVHETVCHLHEAGAMDIRTLRKFDKMCLTPVRLKLKEAGYPFNYISTELVELHGNLETVSKDFGILKRAIDHLSDKIETETKTLTDKIQEGQQNLMEKVENLFSKKFNITAGVIIGALTVIAGAITFFLKSNVDHNALAIGTAVVGIVIIVLTLIINNNQQK